MGVPGVLHLPLELVHLFSERLSSFSLLKKLLKQFAADSLGLVQLALEEDESVIQK